MTDKTAPTHPALFTFANNQHDRRSEVRNDENYLARAWSDPRSQVLVVSGEHLATKEPGQVRWLSTSDAPEGEHIFLGEAEHVAYFGVIVERVAPELGPTSLRQVVLGSSSQQSGLAVHAVGIAQWHRSHPRCARCGELTNIAQGGHVRLCPSCGAHHFPRTDPAVIMLVTDDQDRCLLGHQAAWPEGRYSTLAGFVEPGESLEDAVRREIHEEVGVEVGEVTYAGSQPWPFPTSLMLGFFAKATSTAIHVDGTEIAHARWFTRDEVSELSASEQVVLPGAVSISRWLVDTWHGGEIPGEWR